MLSSIVALILSEQVVSAMLWASFAALILTVVFVGVMARLRRTKENNNIDQ